MKLTLAILLLAGTVAAPMGQDAKAPTQGTITTTDIDVGSIQLPRSVAIDPHGPMSGFVCYKDDPSGGRWYDKCTDAPEQSTTDPRTYPLQICDGTHCDVYPVRPEIHSPMVEVGHCYRVTALETLQEISCPETYTTPFVSTTPLFKCSEGYTEVYSPMIGCGKIGEEAAPFDVPPKEWDGPEEVAKDTCNLSTGICSGVYVPVKIHHVACEDKTRFLLYSEDGKPHCLALGAKP